MKVYSFKDLSGQFTSPVLSQPLFFAGQIGIKKITVSMATERSMHDLGADGTVLISAVAGNNGQVTIDCQQNSITHQALLRWYNAVKIAFDAGDVSDFATASMTLRNISDGSGHNITGISLPKLSDKPYAAQAADIQWVLHAANIENTIGG